MRTLRTASPSAVHLLNRVYSKDGDLPGNAAVTDGLYQGYARDNA